MNFWILASAAYDFGFAAFHVLFWRIFAWPRSLAPSGPLNTAITQTLNLMLGFVFVCAGLAIALTGSAVLLGAGAGFWALRAMVQPLWFKLDRGPQAGMTALFAAGALVHGVAAMSR